MTIDDEAAELVADHVRRLEAGDVEGRGEAANRILDRIHRGAAIEVLEPLFVADDARCARDLIFVLSELGGRAIEAMGWLDVLLDHPEPFVRYHAVAAVQATGSLEHGRVTAKAIAKVEDASPVALGAVRFLAMGSLRQIATAVPHLDGALGEAVGRLAAGDLGDGERPGAADGPQALIGVAAAFRLRAAGDPAPLERLAEAGEEAVAEAAEFVARFRPLPSEGADILHRLAEGDAQAGG